jgi:hypothetical protein
MSTSRPAHAVIRRLAAVVQAALGGLALSCVRSGGNIRYRLSCTDLVDLSVESVREIRMVLLYTAIAAGTGPTADDQIEGEIEQAVLETNVAFSQSGMSVRVVLTHMEKVSVAEPADAVLLTGLTNGTGPLAVAHNLGNAHYADVVGLVTSREGGTGNTMFVPAMSHRDQAFFIAGRSNMGYRFTIAHELGHVLGGVHKRGLVPAPRYSYVYPHFCATCVVNGITGWHTIMSGLQPTATGTTTPIGYFSNADVFFFGVPTGVPTGGPLAADNRKALMNTTTLAAAFRLTPAWFATLRGEGPWFEKRVDAALMSDIRIGDFDGDGMSDAFRVETGTSKWLVSYGASQPWKALWVDPLTVPLNDLRLADFNGDGITDVFRVDLAGNQWLVNWGGAGTWQLLNNAAATSGIPVTQLAFGHLNADKKADVFWSDATTGKWSIASAGQGPWVEINNDPSLKFDTQHLRLADFEGDGVMDVFRSDVTTQKWFVSKNGTALWSTLNGPSAELAVEVSKLAIGDFNGDGMADVVIPTGNAWGVAWAGKNALELLKLSCTRIENMALGDFDGDGSVDVLRAGIRP